MASTSLSLGDHWEIYIKNKIASGRYGTASEVIRQALRQMEEYDSKLEALRIHLAEGEKQASKGEIMNNYSIDTIIQELDSEE